MAMVAAGGFLAAVKTSRYRTRAIGAVVAAGFGVALFPALLGVWLRASGLLNGGFVLAGGGGSG